MLKCVGATQRSGNSASESHWVVHFPEADTSVESVSFVALIDHTQIPGQMVLHGFAEENVTALFSGTAAQTKGLGQQAVTCPSNKPYFTKKTQPSFCSDHVKARSLLGT